MLILNTTERLPRAQKRSVTPVKRYKKQQGFTLMEVMLASFVLAVGMLGSTAMVLRGMQQADETNFETMAVQSATNMAERMRSNIRGQGTSGNFYNNLVADATSVKDCLSTCSPADVALYHAYIWGLELEDSMPGVSPTGFVTALNPGNNDAVFEITVQWNAFKRTSATSADSVVKSYVMIFQP